MKIDCLLTSKVNQAIRTNVDVRLDSRQRPLKCLLEMQISFMGKNAEILTSATLIKSIFVEKTQNASTKTEHFHARVIRDLIR